MSENFAVIHNLHFCHNGSYLRFIFSNIVYRVYLVTDGYDHPSRLSLTVIHCHHPNWNILWSENGLWNIFLGLIRLRDVQTWIDCIRENSETRTFVALLFVINHLSGISVSGSQTNPVPKPPLFLSIVTKDKYRNRASISSAAIGWIPWTY